MENNSSPNTIMENNISPTTIVLIGVPQVFLQGSLLFILYVNDIESIFSESITFKLVADDVKLYSSLDTNFHHTSRHKTVNSVYAWSVTWQLPINFPQMFIFSHKG